MPFMCLTCIERPTFDSGEGAVDHMTRNPFHQMVYYNDKSVEEALKRVKTAMNEDVSD
jgi:hypothetical protein